MIKAILTAILLFISSLFSNAGSSELAGSSEAWGLNVAQHGIITDAPGGLVEANDEQMEHITAFRWESEASPEDFSLNFQNQTAWLPCNGGDFTLVDGGVELSMLTDKACPRGKVDLPFIMFLSEPAKVKVDPDASATPERIYLVGDGKAITLTR
ncbi:hypothetical protein QKE52_07855 [Corynebacterium sp. c25Ua_47]|uniref:hypothetical protein n=1 Tax=Corynebacterium sp. c25Ua_47 TaxID=3032353 RepID=UPI0032641770